MDELLGFIAVMAGIFAAIGIVEVFAARRKK